MKTLLLILACLTLAVAAHAGPVFRTNLELIDGSVAMNVLIMDIRLDGIVFATADGTAYLIPAGHLCYRDKVRFGYCEQPTQGFSVDERRRMADYIRAMRDPDPVRRSNAALGLQALGY